MAEATLQLLNDYYQNLTKEQGLLLTANIKSKWDHMNKWGFFLAIVKYGREEHVSELYNLLNSNQFDNQHTFSSVAQLSNSNSDSTFIDRMFAYYILPFHKDYSDASTCNTPASSVEGLNNQLRNSNEPTHVNLKANLLDRDKVCLFCWRRDALDAAHIIAQKNRFSDTDILQRTGLVCKHQVQNGLLLCNYCHRLFDQLKRYVDVVYDKYVVKIVNFSIDGTGEKQVEWRVSVETMKSDRAIMKTNFWSDDRRQTTESNSEMALYFCNNDPTLQPNREALKCHQIACLIWRMAGGAESDDDSCSDDDFGDFELNYQTRNSSIENWVNSNGSFTNKHTRQENSEFYMSERDNSLNASEMQDLSEI